MSILKRGERWWYEFEFRGQRIRESTGSDSKTLATKAERQRRREVEESANGVRTARRPVFFGTAAHEWMAANKARWSESNVSIQEFNLKHLSTYFGSMPLAEITPQHIGKYQGIRQKEGASNRTMNMEVSTLRMMMKAARLWGAISEDVRMLPECRDIGKALTPDEEKRLLRRAARVHREPCIRRWWFSAIPACGMQSCAALAGVRWISGRPNFESAGQRLWEAKGGLCH